MTDADHWKHPPDRPTHLAGRKYCGFGGYTYELLSHHRCGFHLRVVGMPTDGTSVLGRKLGDMACISERAIDRTYHEIRDER